MIKKIIVLSAVLISGCSSVNSKPNCWFMGSDTYNKSLEKDYQKADSFYMEEAIYNSWNDSKAKSILSTTNKWKSIEVYLIPGKDSFPETEGYYKVSKSYTLDNCIKNYKKDAKEKYETYNWEPKKFCFSAEKISKPSASVKLTVEDKSKGVYFKEVVQGTIKVYIHDEIYIKKNYKTTFTFQGAKSCGTDDEGNFILRRDFR